MRFSRVLAIVLGLIAPILDTIRRWSTWREFPPSLFDDYIIGIFLLVGAWLVGREFHHGQRLLSAAWGFTCGMGYSSFFGQLYRFQQNEIDPAPISSGWVLAIKGIGLLLAAVALIATLRAKEPKTNGKI